jgi:hypothetical protein
LLAWAWTLIKLYKDTENSEKLLPNKHLFTFHGSLLAVYFLLYALSNALDYLAERLDDPNTIFIL